ncbi:MAG: VWA domain-containing protein [Anaerolineales bacterium]|nr:VWA domain-containing protein [Anaerolineales bacterium]
MPKLMRCQYCGLLQDEPVGVKSCVRCGGELVYESAPSSTSAGSYVLAQMELDQVIAPAGQNVDRYLLVTIRTPSQVPAEQSAVTQSGRPPLSYCAILDVSGSMHGDKLQYAKDAIRHAIKCLHDDDAFSLVTFSNDVRSVYEPQIFNKNLLKTIESTLLEITAGGMTALCDGMLLGIKKALKIKQPSNLALILSDGQANVGETDIERIGSHALKARQKGLVLSTLGVGMDYNEALMTEIATQGGGRFYHLQDAAQIPAFMTGELGEVANLAARGAQLELILPPGSTVMPLSSAYPTQQGDGKASILLGDIPSDVELEVPIRLTLPAQAISKKVHVEGSLSYHSPAGNHLNTPLNRVTVRFVEHVGFNLRDGVVTPVVERVLSQMKASDILRVSRAFALNPQKGEQEMSFGLDQMRQYAAKLGEEKAEYETKDVEEKFAAMRASPAMSKMHVSAAFAQTRSTKDFFKK